MSLREAIMRAVGNGRRVEDAPSPDDEDKNKPAAEGDQPVDDEDKPEAEDDPEKDKEPSAEGNDPDPEPDGDPDDTKDMRAARRAERARIAAILTAPGAEANPGLAAHLAFKTDDPAPKAVAALAASSPAGGRLAGRMAAANQPKLGSSASPSAAGDRASRIAAAAGSMINRRRGGHKGE